MVDQVIVCRAVQRNGMAIQRAVALHRNPEEKSIKSLHRPFRV
jgi:hypothetical protein